MAEQGQPSPQFALYQRFVEACIQADEAAMRECVDVDAFYALTPGQGRMTFDQFVQLQRQLNGIMVPGSNRPRVQKVIEQGETIAVKYYMSFTLAVDDRHVETTAVDTVAFQDGKIVELFVTFDRASTREQVFSDLL